MKYRINLKTTRKIWNFSNILQQVKVLIITSMFKKHNVTYMQPTNLDTPRQTSSKVMQLVESYFLITAMLKVTLLCLIWHGFTRK
jgi:hypothetical protein